MNTPINDPVRVARYLQTVRSNRRRILDLEDLNRMLVVSCVTDGASWAEIAEALGISKQAAWSRYRQTNPPKVNPKHLKICVKEDE